MGFPTGFELILSCFVLILSYFWVAVVIVGLCWVGGWKIVFFFFAELLWPLGKRGHLCKSTVRALFSPAFSSRFGRMKIVGLGEKNFSRVFLPPHFPSFAKLWKTLFSTLFSSSVFHPPYFHPNQTQCKAWVGKRPKKGYFGLFIHFSFFL